jgi:hypothetical protein
LHHHHHIKALRVIGRGIEGDVFANGILKKWVMLGCDAVVKHETDQIMIMIMGTTIDKVRMGSIGCDRLLCVWAVGVSLADR